MWKQCNEGLSGSACVTGSATHLLWPDALTAANNSTYADYADWRLPNKKELESLIDRRCYSPAINDIVFPGTVGGGLNGFTWTSTTSVLDPASAWIADFYYGNTATLPKTESLVVRLVRGGQSFDALGVTPSITVRSMTEYRYAALDYYFITSRDSEKSILDTAAGWARTGKSFSVLENSDSGSSPITRFYFDQIARNKSRGSHFYTLLPSEVAAVQALNPTNQPAAGKPVNEGNDSHAYPPSATGACASGQAPVYRLFRGSARFPDDPNHRFTTELSTYNSFVTLGWDGEGVKLCVPQ